MSLRAQSPAILFGLAAAGLKVPGLVRLGVAVLDDAGALRAKPHRPHRGRLVHLWSDSADYSLYIGRVAPQQHRRPSARNRAAERPQVRRRLSQTERLLVK